MTIRTAMQRSRGLAGGAKLAFALALAVSTGCDDDDGPEPVVDAGGPVMGNDAGSEDAGLPPGEDAGPGTMDGGPGLDASTGSDASTGDAGAGEDGGPGEDSGPGDDAGSDGGVTIECNGAAELCDRPYNEIAYPATHNAMSSKQEGFANSDQFYGIDKQLSDGIRAMELDVWKYDPDGDDPAELYLCHGGGCSPGRRKFSEALGVIATFLEENPHDVLTILFEDHASAVDIFAALESAGLREQLYTQAVSDDWPTLGELIEGNTRLVAFFEEQFDNMGNHPTGYQRTWDYGWDTTWEFTKPSDFDDTEGKDCEPLPRGNPNGPLFILNHMLDTGAQAEEFAMTVNLEASLLTRALKCKEKKGQMSGGE